MENDFDIIEGYFVKQIYKNTSYMVCVFETDDGPITVTGSFFDYDDHKYVLKGKYIDHPKYGFQFEINAIEKFLPNIKDEIINYLSSNTFPLVGKKAANTIYDVLGDDALTILKDNPELINTINISPKQKESIINGFKNLNDPQNEIMFYLTSNGFSNVDSQKIFNKFKLNTIEVSKENPFRFYNEIYGINFNKVLDFSKKIEFEDKDIKYKEAYLIHFVTNYTFETGDLYILKEDLYKEISKVDFYDVDIVLDRAIDNNYLIIDEERIYLFNDYNDECFIADYLNKFNSENTIDSFLINEQITINENLLNIRYDDIQKNAIASFLNNSFSIIVGGPGTGKTTIVKTMVNIYSELYPYDSIVVLAPTGRAAKRINEICDVESKTIHSLLKWNLETNTFVFDSDNPISYDAIIIDEFSMVDNNLFASLLKASSRVKKICIIGDENQLPSIRPGFLLNDLIESNIFNVTHLNNNYRQSIGSEIISLAEDIINNDVDLDKYSKDISFYDFNISNIDLVSLIENDLYDGYSLNDIQVLTPMYKGEWGIDNLNIILQDAFNPKDINKIEKIVGKYTFRESDKILQLKNRPGDDVYNGDIGILEDIDLNEKSLLVNYNNVYCFYKYDDLNEISLAYAMSVHKAQGSEYQIVYFIVSKYNLHMLNKKLIYTAISRAKTKLVIIGDKSVFIQGLQRMLKNRKTTLIERLNKI